MQELKTWVHSRGPLGFWLSVLAILLAPLAASFGYDSHTSAGVTGSIMTVIASGVGFLALSHHPMGWTAVRSFAYGAAWVFAVLFLIALAIIPAGGPDAWLVVSLGVSTVVSVAVFQYFKRPSIQSLFPYE